MHKKILSLVLSLSLLQGASLSVLAADVSVKSDPFTATAPSQLIVDETQAGATIKLPASIDLAYDEAYGAFQYKEKIYCDGVIAAGTCIAVKCPERVTYIGANTNEELEAFVKFNDSNVGCFSQNDLENDIGRELLVQIPGTSVATADNFEATINFEISLAAEGMYTTHTTAITDYEPCNGSGYIKLSQNIPITHLTFNNLRSLKFNGGSTKAYAAVYGRTNYYVNNVKYIELSSDNTATFYQTYFTSNKSAYEDPGMGPVGDFATATELTFDTSSLYSNNLVTVFMNMEQLACIAIPNNISKLQLHGFCYYTGSGAPTSTLKYGNHVKPFLAPYWNYNLTDKGTPIGDAIMFVKGINENNSWIYVPNIVYRGTMAEWKALSANGEDWVFGNAANLVTVHCTDGRLYY